MFYIVEISRFIRTSETEQIRQDVRKHFSNHMLAVNYSVERLTELRKQAAEQPSTIYPRYARIWVRILQAEMDKPDVIEREIFHDSVEFKK